MRRAYSAFGASEVVTTITAHAGPMKERMSRIENRLRNALGEADGAEPCESLPRARQEIVRQELTSADLQATSLGASAEAVAESPSITPVPPASSLATARPALRPGYAARAASVMPAPASPVHPPDPEDLEKIRQLEEESEREFAKLHFIPDEDRHALLTVAAAKARRLRTRVHDSYAVDRRLGDLIRKIVDLKRRYRLGWIDGCERTFDVPDWDAYVERCEEHYRELRMRDTMRQEEVRVARERASHLTEEVDRRGRELRAYLDTDEGRTGSEPEKLRAVLMSYLSVEGPLDTDLLERLRVHRSLFTGIAFRRLRKGFERQPGTPCMEEAVSELQRARERVSSRVRGQRALVFAGPLSEDVRRRIEAALGLERLGWIDVTCGDASPFSTDACAQLESHGAHWCLRSTTMNGSVANPESTETALRELRARLAVPFFDVEHPEDADAIVWALDRCFSNDAPSQPPLAER